ncbi:MAG: hypothetical protein KatS3mg114_0191 [Planctomycetaceae bacterium]|nr:MAG: hypothetical protein KatS3mg114_0191 [Planctomycetaceae bacterium]
MGWSNLCCHVLPQYPARSFDVTYDVTRESRWQNRGQIYDRRDFRTICDHLERVVTAMITGFGVNPLHPRSSAIVRS